MTVFHIERSIPGVGNASAEEMDQTVQTSESVLTAMRGEGKHIRQIRSFATADSIFCVYEADSEDFIHEHSQRSNIPVSKVTPVIGEVQHDTTGL